MKIFEAAQLRSANSTPNPPSQRWSTETPGQSGSNPMSKTGNLEQGPTIFHKRTTTLLSVRSAVNFGGAGRAYRQEQFGAVP
jgi:hypothetical protein